MHEVLNEIGCTKRDIVLLGIDNNGGTGESEVSDEEVNEEQKEKKKEEERNRSKVLGKWGFGKRNENGKRLIEECVANGWSIANTFFSLPKKKKWTFYGAFHGRKHREYDHIICNRLTRKRIVKIQNVRNYWLDSDHCLRTATVQLKCKELRQPERERALTKVMRSYEAVEMIEEEVASKL